MQKAENGKYVRKLNIITVVLCVLILLLSAVNLSFAADSFSQSDLEGDWKSHAIFSSAENWEGWERADMAVDGETASPSNIEDSDEYSGGIFPAATISIDSDGIITMPTDNSFEGILNSDKDFIVVTSGYPGTDNPGLGIFVKRTGATFATADFEGDWIGHFISSSATGWEGWKRIDMTANNSGVFTLGYMENSDEYSETTGEEATFSISSDGIVTLSEEESLEGIMSPDKNIIVLTDEYSSLDNPELALLVKRTGATFATADLEGDWKIHAIYSSDNAADWEGWERGDAAIDGSGNLTFNGTDSGEQTLEGTATLSIGSNGIITSAGEDSFKGIMSPDKTVIVFTSGGSGGDDPRLTIAVKRVETEDGGSDDSGSGCFITSLYQ
ncbi:MAG: hypothetical protein JRC90_09420 [Deltaproteobacteria bacterium]|nr:hypothetical protein [Deltaproteobacteria bacterium]